MSCGILIDTTKCVACEKCVNACLERHHVGIYRAIRERQEYYDGLSAYRPTTITVIEPGHFAKKSCMHCLEPSCVSACLVGGITKTPEGPVVYDSDKCIGCRYCMLACPFHIPRYEWDTTNPYMVKCDMCADRIEQERLPACVEACPEGVLKFGQRDELLIEAHKRMRQNPQLYLNHVWGEKEFGGTSVLYISDVDLNVLGWPKTTPKPIPSLTEPLVHTTPLIGLSVAVGLVSLNWIIKRRNKLAETSSDKNLSDKQAEDNDHEQQ
jgi:formate dehydrogenase iron-sulfur subunit